MKMYDMQDLEWCSGRMAHLRVKGQWKTLCGADPNYFKAAGADRDTITPEEADQKHKCKSCVKRVRGRD